jgi:hypothetical protein
MCPQHHTQGHLLLPRLLLLLLLLLVLLLALALTLLQRHVLQCCHLGLQLWLLLLA